MSPFSGVVVFLPQRRKERTCQKRILRMFSIGSVTEWSGFGYSIAARFFSRFLSFSAIMVLLMPLRCGNWRSVFAGDSCRVVRSACRRVAQVAFAQNLCLYRHIDCWGGGLLVLACRRERFASLRALVDALLGDYSVSCRCVDCRAVPLCRRAHSRFAPCAECFLRDFLRDSSRYGVVGLCRGLFRLDSSAQSPDFG